MKRLRSRHIAKQTCTRLARFFAILCFATSSSAMEIDFDSLGHGEVANGSIEGVTISAVNNNRKFNYAVGFDSHAMNTEDPDLEANEAPMQWSGGNIADQNLRTILILQENSAGCAGGTCSLPDDEGGRPAGVLRFEFSVPILDLGFDLIDIESLTAEDAMIEFFDGTVSATVDLMDFFDRASALYDPTLVLGNNTANRFVPIRAGFLGLSQIDRVDFNLGGSGGLDNLTMTSVPESTPALLVCLGLVTMTGARRVVLARHR